MPPNYEPICFRGTKKDAKKVQELFDEEGLNRFYVYSTSLGYSTELLEKAIKYVFNKKINISEGYIYILKGSTFSTLDKDSTSEEISKIEKILVENNYPPEMLD